MAQQTRRETAALRIASFQQPPLAPLLKGGNLSQQTRRETAALRIASFQQLPLLKGGNLAQQTLRKTAAPRIASFQQPPLAPLLKGGNLAQQTRRETAALRIASFQQPPLAPLLKGGKLAQTNAQENRRSSDREFSTAQGKTPTARLDGPGGRDKRAAIPDDLAPISDRLGVDRSNLVQRVTAQRLAEVGLKVFGWSRTCRRLPAGRRQAVRLGRAFP